MSTIRVEMIEERVVRPRGTDTRGHHPRVVWVRWYPSREVTWVQRWVAWGARRHHARVWVACGEPVHLSEPQLVVDPVIDVPLHLLCGQHLAFGPNRFGLHKPKREEQPNHEISQDGVGVVDD